MRLLFPLLVALACPVGMCLIPMLLMRRHGKAASYEQPGAERESDGAQQRRAEVAMFRDDLSRTQREDSSA